jgi:hypothetical protein
MTPYKHIIASGLVLIILVTLALPLDVEARAGGGRSGGGGRSFGGSSKMYSPNVGNRSTRTYGQPPRTPVQPSTNRSFNTPNQSSFFQRNPLMGTFGAAIAGSWIGNMLFGNSSSHAAPNASNPEIDPAAASAQPANVGSSDFSALFSVLLIGVGIYFALKLLKNKNNKGSLFSRPSNAPSLWSGHSEQASFERARTITLPTEEQNAFSAVLCHIQTAWSDQDLAAFKRLCTTEMLGYFRNILNKNISEGVENKVENVNVTHVQIHETWEEDGMEYATAALTWTAKDYTVNLHLQPYEAGYIVEGNKDQPIESTEVWTYVRPVGGTNWILSAIQQA